MRITYLVACGLLALSYAVSELRTSPQRDDGLLAQVARLRDEVKQLQQASLPVGSVVAWASGTKLPSESWRVCESNQHVTTEDMKGPGYPDDRAKERLEDLRSLLEKYQEKKSDEKDTKDKKDNVVRVKLPDFSGCFLRGHGTGSGSIGDRQEFWTGAPAKMRRDDAPDDRFGYTGGRDNQWFSVLEMPIPPDGELPKDHVRLRLLPAAGGFELAFDSETRPVNFAVQWIIRIK